MTIASEPQLHPEADLTAEVACECMLCDLPERAAHGPVEWKVVLLFPGPYPAPGTPQLLMCDHCMNDWMHGEWEPPLDNFFVLNITPV